MQRALQAAKLLWKPAARRWPACTPGHRCRLYLRQRANALRIWLAWLLEHGKHLFVEKPIAASYIQAGRGRNAAQSTRIDRGSGPEPEDFYRSINLCAALRAGSVRWRYAEAVFHKAEFRNPPAFGASTFLSANGIHALDAMLFMMQGLPIELTSMAASPGGGPKSTFSALMRWQDGAQGVFLCNNDAGARREEYVFHGLGETYRIDDSGVTAEANNTISKTPCRRSAMALQNTRRSCKPSVLVCSRLIPSRQSRPQCFWRN